MHLTIAANPSAFLQSHDTWQHPNFEEEKTKNNRLGR